MFDAVFLPADPPRAGRLALYGDLAAAGVVPDSKVELVLPRGDQVRRTKVAARLLPVEEALALLTRPPSPDDSASHRAWAAAALAGVGLIARGRLVPDRTPSGYGAWRVAPLDPTDHGWLKNLGAAMPAHGHAVPVEGSRPLRLAGPEQLVRAFWDALADTLVRTPAAGVAVRGGAAAFAEVEPRELTGSTAWLDETALSEEAGARLVLRIEPPEDDSDFKAVLQLRSGVDPSLLVDVADVWSAPAAVLAALGERAETDLLLALRRGARVWPPLGAALRDAAPAEVPVDDVALDELAGDSDALEGAGIEVLWPAELFAGELALRGAVQATPTPGAVTGPDFSLTELLAFKWRPTLDGQELTEAEVAALAEAKRPMIRMRGRWVRIDQDLVRKLRSGGSRKLTGAEALGAALTGSLEIDGELVAFDADGSLLTMVDRLRAASEPEPFPEQPVGLRATLRDYQRRGVAWMAQLAELGFGGCLADDMGLGKTIQVIALHLHLSRRGRGPTLVVCPSTLLGTWERELEKFAPEVPTRRYHGAGRSLSDLAADEVVMTTYGVVRQDHRVLGEIFWGLAVADEAQHAKNPLSRTARALRTLPAATRLALTGTPVENRLSELWSILDWAAPGLLGTLDRFRHDVAVPVERYHDEEATARLARVTRPFLLRRRKSDPGIAPELPQKSEHDVVVPLTAEQATLYQAVARETLAKIESAEGIARRGLVLSLLTQLKQVCNHPAQFLHEPGPLPRRSGKLAALDELLDVILAEGESVLIFSQYVEMCRLIESHLAARQVRTLFLHGGIGVRKREQLVEQFQAGEAQVFLLSLKAGGVGLTLTKATHVVHYDRWWNPAVEDQATDRAYRIGQDKPVQVHRLVTENTLEDRISTVIAAKRELADAVVGSGEAWLSELSDADLTELVALSTTPAKSGAASAYNPSSVGKSTGVVGQAAAVGVAGPSADVDDGGELDE
ncbi:SNF2 family DNA or RNA helicase [Kribbella orskensis]|uniref:SNF2 family DNA or RNA helicase n=1 Tax=Kribbella orskensis TaxID=2512216 RepID=A0ABY2B704_9ACTN|nr:MULTISPECIES: DEAD/DEAH box helicase [Kribbella]TCN28841.1 SNF2 family DNA or RNA helicase [Kribbella sp. VKM Ac-2500]TCO08680.1 SNF2 family DNA or RNA helicase [Kribbella orskensis]